MHSAVSGIQRALAYLECSWSPDGGIAFHLIPFHLRLRVMSWQCMAVRSFWMSFSTYKCIEAAYRILQVYWSASKHAFERLEAIG
jgi:hypothetical protein